MALVVRPVQMIPIQIVAACPPLLSALRLMTGTKCLSRATRIGIMTVGRHPVLRDLGEPPAPK
jgi:hypothetical protein